LKGFTKGKGKSKKFIPTSKKSGLKKDQIRSKKTLPEKGNAPRGEFQMQSALTRGKLPSSRFGSKPIHGDEMKLAKQLDKEQMQIGRADRGRDKQSMDNPSSESDMIHYILQNTDDGNELGGRDLSLIEAGANGNLNEAGKKALKELHKKVQDGDYELPRFHGIKHMSQDQEGYVLWRGKRVEHYTFDDYQDEEFSAKELEANILDLESKGVDPTWGNISDNFDNLRKNQNQWERTNYLVSAFDKSTGRRTIIESDWTHGRDKQHAKEEFVRKHPEVKFSELEILTNEEWNKKYPRGRNG